MRNRVFAFVGLEGFEQLPIFTAYRLVPDSAYSRKKRAYIAQNRVAPIMLHMTNWSEGKGTERVVYQ